MKKTTSILICVISLTYSCAYAQQAAERKAVTPTANPPAVSAQAPIQKNVPEKPEMVKVKVEVSQQVIDQQMNAYKGNLKEIVKEAENNLKKIDGELKKKDGEEAVNKHLKAADAYSAEGKIDKAKTEFKAAMVEANTPALKKTIKEKEHSVDKQAKEIESKNGQDTRAKEETVKTAPEVKKKTIEEEASQIYKDAVSLYWDNKYSEAKLKFEQVQQMSPGYARTSYYLERIKEKLPK